MGLDGVISFNIKCLIQHWERFVQSLGLRGGRTGGGVGHLDVWHIEQESKLKIEDKNVCSEQKNAVEIMLLGKRKKKWLSQRLYFSAVCD